MINEKLKGINFGIVFISISVFIVVIVFLSLGEDFKINDTQTQTSISEKIDVTNVEDQIDLHVQAQQFVLQTLKAPSTAKFPALPYEVIDLGNGRYKIISYVDSQNSFGAMLRSDWSVLMKLDTNLWSPERIVVGGEVVYDPIQAQKNTEKAIADKKKLDQEIEKAQMMIDEAQKDIDRWQ